MASDTGTWSRRTIVDGYARLYPHEVAGILEGLPTKETVEVLEGVQGPQALAVFQCLSPDAAAEALGGMSEDAALRLVKALEPARAAALLARLDKELRDHLLDRMRPRAAKELKTLMAYPADSAGYLMDPRATTFRPDTTVEQALSRLRGVAPRRVYNLFLVDGEGRLVGTVALQDAALAPPGTRLEDLARGAPVSIPALASREEVVELLDRHKLASFPVVDFEGRIVGVVRHDALIAAAEEEASADIQKMMGVSEEERALSHVSFAVRKRLPWLHVNLGTAFLAASVVGLFEDTIAKYTALAVLLPVVAGQSGNTGAQALVVTMRGLALREVTMRHWRRVLYKEFSVGLLNGVAVALVTALGVFFWSGSFGLSLVIGLAMVMAMAIAGVAGAAVPLVLSATGQDPAQSSSIILTTVTDVFGFFSFLGLATAFASML